MTKPGIFEHPGFPRNTPYNNGYLERGVRRPSTELSDFVPLSKVPFPVGLWSQPAGKLRTGEVGLPFFQGGKTQNHSFFGLYSFFWRGVCTALPFCVRVLRLFARCFHFSFCATKREPDKVNERARFLTHFVFASGGSPILSQTRNYVTGSKGNPILGGRSLDHGTWLVSGGV